MCIDLAADGIIILMVESEFALVKSQNMIRDIFGENTEKFDVILNIETKTAVENLDKILNTMNSAINGITIGRSDLAYSYNKRVNSLYGFLQSYGVYLYLKFQSFGL
jgi:2-keto-3-deoxy-L-rhamnonate aldolase RhmA